MTTYTINEEFNGIEITFDSKPAAQIRDQLKANGFRWHRQKALWYAKNTPARLKIAEEISEGKTPEAVTEAKPKANKFGVQVGDIFTSSWGYEQTNNTFFQVVALAGTTSVRVREIHPALEEEEAVSSMSANRTYKVNKEEQAYPPTSLFIKDQEAGDIKRLKSYAADGVSNPEFRMSSFANAYLVQGGSVKVYDSRYA